MFVQVIRGRTSDPEALARQGDKWRDEVKPGAEGFLGGTNGVTADGEVVTIARFEDEAAARRNGDRPEQGKWWSEMEGLYESPPTFVESSEVDLLLEGGSDDAGFVQVMEGTIADPDAARAFEGATVDQLRDMRPDLLGTLRVIHPDGRFTELAYFTSEADARSGEGKEMPEELAASFQAYSQNVQVERYLDLPDPKFL